MICPNEYVWAQYADNELPETEAEDLISHLDCCTACRKQLSALEDEKTLLVRSMQEVEWWQLETEPLKRSAIVNWTCLLVLGAVLLRAAFSLLEDIEPPSMLRWLSPLDLHGRLNLAANAIFYFLEKGGPMLASLIENLGTMVLCILLIGSFIAFTRRARGITMVSVIALMFALVVPSYAIEVRRAGKGSVNVGANQTVNDTLVVFADSVDISGTITGDLVAFARRVTVHGTVQGNVVGFAQRLDIPGNVEGDVFGFGQTIQSSGTIGRNLWAFAQTVNIQSSGKLQQDATLFSSEISMEGPVGRDLTAIAGNVELSGNVERSVFFRGGQLSVRTPTKIGGNLNIWTKAEKDIQIDPGVEIRGKKTIQLEKAKRSRYFTAGFYFGQLLRIAAAFITGWLLFWLFPNLTRVPISTGRDLLKSGGIGFLAAVATPVAAVILGITLIGLPIGLSAFVLWLLGLYLAKIVVARFIGSSILGIASPTLALLTGIVLVVIAVNLPYIGAILNFVMVLVGLGAIVFALYLQITLRRRTGLPDGAAL